MLKYKGLFLSFSCLFIGALGPLFFISDLDAQDYRRTRNFNLESSDRSASKVSQDTSADGNLSQEEYLRRKEAYLRQFRKDKGDEQAEQERDRLNQRAQEQKENRMLEQEVAQAREREKRWQEGRRVREELEKKPVVPQQLENSLNPNSGTDRQQMVKELQGLQDKIKSGDVNLEEIFETLNNVSGANQQNIEIPAEYEGEVAAQVYKSLYRLRAIPPEALTAQLKQQLNGHPLESVLTSNEQTLPTLVNVLQDPKALPDASLILSDRKKLIWYALFNLGFLIFGFILKRRIKKSDVSFFKGVTLQLTRIFGFAGLSLCVFLFFFGDNLKSLWAAL